MVRMSAAADPRLAIEHQLYVPPPTAISDLIVRRFEIEPTSRHLVVGSVGAGKTTQLLVAQNQLDALEDVSALYVDVSEKQDLAQLRPGSLIALAGMALQELADQKTLPSTNWSHFNSWTRGYWRDTNEPDDFDDGTVFVPGIIKPPTKWPNIADHHVETLRDASKLLSAEGAAPVLLFDSLDRLTSGNTFPKTIEQDVGALNWAGIGVVLIGPIRSLAGFGRIEADRFDYLHTQSPIDIDHDDKGRTFLINVLLRRAGAEMLSEEAATLLVKFSGGVLRDLIQLAKNAGDAAYLRGADIINDEHAILAADGFGRALMVGLRPEEIETLKHLRTKGGFVQTSDDELALLATRRVLEYRGRPNPYAVHPTVIPLLDQIAGRS